MRASDKRATSAVRTGPARNLRTRVLFLGTAALLLLGFDWPTTAPSGDEAQTESIDSPETPLTRVSELHHLLENERADEAVSLLQEVRRAADIDPDMLDAVRELIQYPLSRLRVAAADVLGEHGISSDQRLLIRLLGDRVADVRIQASSSLTAYASHSAVVAVSALLDDTNSEVRVAAAKALGEMSQREGTLPLLDAMLRHDRALELEAIEALGKIRDDRAVSALAVRLENPEYEVRARALAALGSINSVDSLEPIVRRATSPGGGSVPFRAIQAAGNHDSESDLARALIAHAGTEALLDLIASNTVSPPIVRAVYRHLSAGGYDGELPAVLLREAAVAGALVGDEQEREQLEQHFGNRVLGRGGEGTIEERCALDEFLQIFSHFESDEITSARQQTYQENELRQLIITVRLVHATCGSERLAALIHPASAYAAVPAASLLASNDPVRTWLLTDGVRPETARQSPDIAWQVLGLLSEMPVESIRAASFQFGEEGINAALSHGWASGELSLFLSLLSEEARAVVQPARDSRNEPSSWARQRSWFDCEELPDGAESEGSPWAAGVKLIWETLCVEVASDNAPQSGSFRTNLEIAGGYGPGSDHVTIAETIWRQAADESLDVADIESCLRYSLGNAPTTVQTACLLAARRMSDPSETILWLRERLEAELAGIRVAPIEHTLLVNVVDSVSGRGLWGAPVILFLQDGRTVSSNAAEFGFLALPRDRVAGVAPR